MNQFSIFRLSPGFIRKRRMPICPFTQMLMERRMLFYCQMATPTSPGNLSVIEFIDNFKPSWADTLLQLHLNIASLKEFDALQASMYGMKNSVILIHSRQQSIVAI